MPELSLQDLNAKLENELPALKELLLQSLDFSQLEQQVMTLVANLVADVLAQALQELLDDVTFLEQLRALGAQLGLRFKEYRVVRLRLAWGQEITVRAPYFLKAPAKDKRRRRKRGLGGSGRSLGLDVLGFVERCSALLISDVVQQVLLSPSFEVAQQVLAQRGIVLNIKTLRRLCEGLAKQGMAARGVVSLTGNETLKGLTLVIGIDGGRMRERRRKRGRRPKGQKRQGYHSDWKEPKLFTISVYDDQGEVVKEIEPFYDATLGDHKALFALLEQYLRALDLDEVGRVVWCGDGAPWIWKGVEALVERLALELSKVYQVLDYTHAKQNVRKLLELLPKRLRHAALEERWKALLWSGDIEALRHEIERTFTSKSGRQKALRKWRSFFESNAKRMRYSTFESEALPCGSGSVESAIRRVINLRLKAPGSFWTREMGECMLFLRSQLLCGRWEVMLHNITRKLAKQLISRQIIGQAANEYEPAKAA